MVVELVVVPHDGKTVNSQERQLIQLTQARKRILNEVTQPWFGNITLYLVQASETRKRQKQLGIQQKR